MNGAEMPPFGIIAEFNDHESLLNAAKQARELGFRRFDAYSPFPVEGLADAIGFKKNRVPLCCLLGGLTGGIGGYFMQWYANVISYPVNVGGRPFHSAPAFIPITFELTILCAAIAAIGGMLMLNGLPRPHHPIFAAKNFAASTTDKFFLCIESSDPKFDTASVTDFLRAQHAKEISEVPAE